MEEIHNEQFPILSGAAIACAHKDTPETQLVCIHMVDQDRPMDYHQWFTGVGKRYYLVCEACAKKFKEDQTTPEFRYICWNCAADIEDEGCWEGIIGQPEIRTRPSTLTIVQRSIPFPLVVPLLAFEPMNTQQESIWLALTVEGDLVSVDLTAGTATHLMHLPDSQLDLARPVSLYLSLDNTFVAIVNTKGQYGIVVNLTTQMVTMELARDTYRIEHSSFPIAFFECEGRLLLVHSTAWNRLDLSDPHTGELVSKRELETLPDKKRPEHLLDYFHAGLSVSPDQQWIVDNGWIWHPIGALIGWNLTRWVQENVWESEDGPSRKSLCAREYYWDGPLCWIDGKTLAVWGYGRDDLWLIPAVRLFDVATGEETGWFAGPEQGTLVFDEYLFSLSQEHGLSAWDVSTGERVGTFPDFQPTHYHRGARQFVRIDTQNGIALVGTVTQ